MARSDTDQSLEERVEPSIVHEMKFADHHRAAILDGEKTLTARLADGWGSLCSNDGLAILDESGTRYAEAVVDRARSFQLQEAFHIVNFHSGHASYDSPRTFGEDLAGYYPDADIGPETVLLLIHFEVIARV